MSQKDGMNGIELISLKSVNGDMSLVCSNVLCVKIGSLPSGDVIRCLSQGLKYAQPPPQGYESGVYEGLATNAFRLV